MLWQHVLANEIRLDIALNRAGRRIVPRCGKLVAFQFEFENGEREDAYSNVSGSSS